MKKYEKVALTLKERIDSGVYGNKLPSESELMEEFNVSRVTIRNGLELLQQSYSLKRSKKGGTQIGAAVKTDTVKHIVFVMLFSAVESIRIIEGAEKIFSDNNMSLTIKFSNCSAKSERAIIEDLLTMDIDGLIIYPANSAENVDLFTSIMDKHIPLVFVDKYPNKMICSSVSIDNPEAAKTIVQYLTGLGHKNIAFFANDIKNLSTRERVWGYMNEMAAHGLPAGKEHIFIVDTPQKTAASFERFFLQNVKPTGVICSDDTLAVQFIEEAQRRGYRVPDDFSVVGIDNRYFPEYAGVPLTTICQPFYELGHWAARTIKHLLSGSGMKAEKIYLPTELVIRDSARKISG